MIKGQPLHFEKKKKKRQGLNDRQTKAGFPTANDGRKSWCVRTFSTICQFYCNHTDKVIIILQIQFAYVQLKKITETCVTKQSFNLFVLNNFS